jgi:hypothetical protein
MGGWNSRLVLREHHSSAENRNTECVSAPTKGDEDAVD